MSNLDISFASLVKYNNGYFKSEKQAAFLLSKCNNNEYSVSACIYNNSFTIIYTCDSVGIKSVAKVTRKDTVITWERLTGKAAEVAIQKGVNTLNMKKELKEIEAELDYQKEIRETLMDKIMSGEKIDADKFMVDNNVMADNEVQELRNKGDRLIQMIHS